MGVTLETRKPIDHLMVSDFSTFPVWEFATDEEGVEGQDETWVRPLDTRVVPKGGWSLHVAADIKVACGRAYSGFVGLATADPFDVNAAIILHDGYLLIPTPAYSDFQKMKEALLSRLGLSDSELFPITYTLRVLIEGEQTLRTGVLI